MWRSLRVDLKARKASWQEVPPEEVAFGGRYRTGQALWEREAYRVDPSPRKTPGLRRGGSSPSAISLRDGIVFPLLNDYHSSMERTFLPRAAGPLLERLLVA